MKKNKLVDDTKKFIKYNRYSDLNINEKIDESVS